MDFGNNFLFLRKSSVAKHFASDFCLSANLDYPKFSMLQSNFTGYEDSKYLLSISGEPVEYLSWRNVDEERDALKKVLKTLKTKEFESKDVMYYHRF